MSDPVLRVAILSVGPPPPSAVQAERLAAYGAECRPIVVPPASLRTPLRRLFAGRRIAGQNATAAFDLIHAAHVEASEIALALASRWHLPYLLSIDEFLRPGEGFRIARSLCRGVLVPEADLADDLAEGLAVPSRLISRIPFAAEVAPEGDRPSSGGFRPVIGMASGTGLGSGLPIFFEAAARLRDSGVEAEFVVAAEPGRGPFAGALAEAQGLRGKVTFVDDTDLDRAFWPALDLYAHPARRPTTGRRLLEAMGRGIPAIASDVRGLTGPTGGGSAARLVPPGEAAALAGAMRELLEGSESADRLGRAGRARVADRHDPGRRSEALARLYRAALAAGRADSAAPGVPAPSCFRSYTLAQQRKS